MEQHEIDKLISDIEDYLRQAERKDPATVKGTVEAICGTSQKERAAIDAGLFITPDSRKKMGRFIKYSRFASHAVEALTIGLFTTGMLAPFSSWPRTLMFLLAVLLFGIFTITVLLSLHARTELLIQIESNTRNIALTKARIAQAIEKIKLE